MRCSKIVRKRLKIKSSPLLLQCISLSKKKILNTAQRKIRIMNKKSLIFLGLVTFEMIVTVVFYFFDYHSCGCSRPSFLNPFGWYDPSIICPMICITTKAPLFFVFFEITILTFVAFVIYLALSSHKS
jgi:hypothetical protein